MHGGKSEGVTHESMCHYHLIPHQFEWEKSSVDEIEKVGKRKERERRDKEGKVCLGRGEETRIGEKKTINKEKIKIERKKKRKKNEEERKGREGKERGKGRSIAQ